MMWYRGLGIACLMVLFGACDDTPASPSHQPNLLVMLTDDHTDAIEEVNLFFTSVTANPVDGAPETLDLELENNPQDLLMLQDTVVTLATGIVEPGDYEFLMINLDESQSNVVEGGETKSLRIPSQEIKVLGGFEIAEDGSTTVTLDFDAEASLVQLGNGEWLLTPVIAREIR